MKFMIKAAIAVCAAMADSIYARSTGLGQEVYNGFNIDISWDEATTYVTFKVVMPRNTWLGIVLGSYTHTNSDMLIFTANGVNSKFYDTYSSGNFEP